MRLTYNKLKFMDIKIFDVMVYFSYIYYYNRNVYALVGLLGAAEMSIDGYII